GSRVEVERPLSPGPDAPEPGDAHDHGACGSVMSGAEALRTSGIMTTHAEQRGCEESRKASERLPLSGRDAASLVQGAPLVETGRGGAASPRSPFERATWSPSPSVRWRPVGDPSGQCSPRLLYLGSACFGVAMRGRAARCGLSGPPSERAARPRRYRRRVPRARELGGSEAWRARSGNLPQPA